MFKEILFDARSIAKRDPAARSTAQVVFLYSGLRALIYYRISHWFYKRGRNFIARYVSELGKRSTGIEIHPGATIGRGLFIDHGTGVVIGETAEIGDNVTIYQGATLGGTGKDTGKRHPTIGDNVLISSGAKILGPFKVGDNARIGANAVVLSEVEPGVTVIGVPGRAVRRGTEKIASSMASEELDQIHVPDPVSQELCKLLTRIENLENEIAREKGQNSDKKEEN